MRMNRLFIFLCSVVALSSCQLATFSSRPGVQLKSYPKELHGTYQSIEKHDGVRDTNYIVINEEGAKMNDEIMDKIIDLSDTNNSLSHLGDFYFLNVSERDSAGQSHWYIYPFEYDGKHLYIYTLSLGRTQKKLGKYLKASGKRNGSFTMENESFRKYCEKHLKKRKAMKLKRIK